MKRPTVGLALEGLPIIGLAALSSVVFGLIGCATMAFILLLACAFCLHFFRDPERIPPADASLAVAPADGKVVKVGQARDPVSGEERTVVCIFMNVFNVHVNRSPVEATLSRIDYFPGKFINASFDKASQDNERAVLSLTGADGGKWTVVQIAGLVARRIVCRADVGDRLSRGERFGLIKFGALVDCYLPSGYAPLVRVGDKTTAGQTAIARPSA